MEKFELSKSDLKIKKAMSNSLLRSAFFSILIFFTSCAVSLAPKFDQEIVDNLSASSTEIFQLFAEISGGVTSSDFNKREEKYNSVIGKIEALELQIQARPVPKSKLLDKIRNKVNDRLAQKGQIALAVGDTTPSASALFQIRQNLEKMKAADKSNGLTRTEVQAFKGNIEKFLDQALTYEGFLNK